MTLRIVTFLWQDPTYRWNSEFIYGLTHVRKLFSAIDRNLNIPHENVVITDTPGEDFGPGVRVVPLWEDFRHLPGWRGVGKGCYVRLKAFSAEMGTIIGERFVWFDLDTVILGSLDQMLSRTEDFIAWRDVHPPTPYCGSMVMMTAGARAHVWESFRSDPSGCIQRAARYIGTDQAHIGHVLGTQEAVWTESDGVYNFRHHIYQPKKGLPENAKVVFFTGKFDPSMPELQREYRWIQRHWR